MIRIRRLVLAFAGYWAVFEITACTTVPCLKPSEVMEVREPRPLSMNAY